MSKLTATIIDNWQGRWWSPHFAPEDLWLRGLVFSSKVTRSFVYSLLLGTDVGCGMWDEGVRGADHRPFVSQYGLVSITLLPP